MEKCLTEEKCLEMLKEYGTPEHVVRHCREVARVAVCVARALKEKGYRIDVSLVQEAALLHDIARVEDKHWEVGARLLHELGHDEAAGIIYEHMFHSFPDDISAITETDLVCLGDRVVKEDRFVGLEDRMNYVLNKFDYPEHVRQKIIESTRLARIFIDKIEAAISMPLEILITDEGKED